MSREDPPYLIGLTARCYVGAQAWKRKEEELRWFWLVSGATESDPPAILAGKRSNRRSAAPKELAPFSW